MNEVSKLAWKLSPTGRSLQQVPWDAVDVHMFEVRYQSPKGEQKSIQLYTKGQVDFTRTQANAVVLAMTEAFEAGQQSALRPQPIAA